MRARSLPASAACSTASTPLLIALPLGYYALRVANNLFVLSTTR